MGLFRHVSLFVMMMAVLEGKHYGNGSISKDKYPDDWVNNRRRSNVIDSGSLSTLKKRSKRVPIANSTYKNIINEHNYYFGKILTTGDYMEVTGVYAQTSTFAINIKSDDGKLTLFHAGFRPSENQIVFNSKLTGGWGTEVRTGLPEFQIGIAFKITIVFGSDHYRLLFNDDAINQCFHYRHAIKDASYVWFSGSSGENFLSLNIPDTKMNRENEENLIRIIKQNVAGKSVEEVKAYANSDKGTLAMLQYTLLRNLHDRYEKVDMSDETIKWILNDREALETVMTSGDVDHYKKAVEILAKLIVKDPKAKYRRKLRLAVSIALTFSNDVFSLAYPSKRIDGYKRYENYAKWNNKRVLSKTFNRLSAWHMRYVVGSWAEDTELVWAREKIPEKNKPDHIVANAVHSMVSFKLFNDNGTSVHSPDYYYNQPITMECIQKVGAVCGGISKFGTAMLQAFGIPALPVTQPGHCAYMWYTNGTWELNNNIYGWSSTNVHGGIQYSWKKSTPFMLAMNTAQLNKKAYRLSETMRIASEFAGPGDKFGILEQASTECPQNYAVWMEMTDALSHTTLDKPVIQSLLEPSLSKTAHDKNKISNVALNKKVTTDCNAGKIHMMVNGREDTWKCDKSSVTFEIDLGSPSKINEVKIHWWGWSYSKDFDFYAADVNGNYALVKTEKDETVQGGRFNGWSDISGWAVETVKLKVVMRDGKLDPWLQKSYFGVRQFQVSGFEVGADIPYGKPDTSASPYSWIKIDLKKVGLINNIQFKWAEDSKAKNMTIITKVADRLVQEKAVDGDIQQVEFEWTSGTEVVVYLNGLIEVLPEVRVMGCSYTAKEILKIKVKSANMDKFVENDIKESIDNIDYDG